MATISQIQFTDKTTKEEMIADIQAMSLTPNNDAGSPIKGVYIKDGKPVALKNEIGEIVSTNEDGLSVTKIYYINENSYSEEEWEQLDETTKKQVTNMEYSLTPGSLEVVCTQAEYDAWEEAGTIDPDTTYYITDGMVGLNYVVLTKAEYKALGDKVLDDNIVYIVTDEGFYPTVQKVTAISSEEYFEHKEEYDASEDLVLIEDYGEEIPFKGISFKRVDDRLYIYEDGVRIGYSEIKFV